MGLRLIKFMGQYGRPFLATVRACCLWPRLREETEVATCGEVELEEAEGSVVSDWQCDLVVVIGCLRYRLHNDNP